MSASAGVAKVTAQNYRANLEALWATALLIRESPVAEMLAAAEHAESVGAILDPTAFREKADALLEDIEVLRALHQVQQTVERIAARRARSSALPARGSA